MLQVMGYKTARASELRRQLASRSPELHSVLWRYGASNPRLFGSVARGDASQHSDIDILVDLNPGGGNPLLRIAGMSEELTELLGVQVDVVCDELLHTKVSTNAHAEAIAL